MIFTPLSIKFYWQWIELFSLKNFPFSSKQRREFCCYNFYRIAYKSNACRSHFYEIIIASFTRFVSISCTQWYIAQH